MKNPRQEIFNSMAEKWDEMIILTPRQKATIKHVINNSKLSKQDKILDVGCGTGVLIPYIIKNLGDTGKIICIDVSDKMIKVAKKKNNDKRVAFKHSDIFKYKKKNYFDKIFLFHDKKNSFKIFHDLLKKGGKLVIFHVESSIFINNLHKNKIENEILKNDHLPDINEIKKLIDLSLWKIISTEDKEGLYLVYLEKL